MTTSEIGTLVLSWAAGFGLGAFFYGGLWWTVRRTLVSPAPAQWMLGSALVRMGVVMAGFYLVAGSHGERWLLCVVGLTVARAVVTWLTKRSEVARIDPPQELGHAP